MKKITKIELRILTKNDYDSWKNSHLNQLPPQNKWDRSHRNQDTSKRTYIHLLKEQRLARFSEKRIEYAIFTKKTNEFVGFVMAMDIVRGITQSAYLGYILLNQFWGKGIAVEANNAFFKIAFTELALHRLQAGIEPKNIQSIKVAKKLKMRREGKSQKVVYLRGEWQDLIQYAITSEELGIKWKGTTKKPY